ncbi:hypothetical protein [Deinococcus apachensis]|uniref:hypothetical protein n=1 Tax=Deinococcus apachensis TaxID=309886 RepID=UPI000364A76C|nr:hypothetical protein [Deinococcus apachensis]
MPYAVRLQYVHKDAQGQDAVLDEPHWLEDDAGGRRVFSTPQEADEAARIATDGQWLYEVVEVPPEDRP